MLALDPASLEEPARHFHSQRPAEMGSAFSPVEAREREPPSRSGGSGNIDIEPVKHLGRFGAEIDDAAPARWTEGFVSFESLENGHAQASSEVVVAASCLCER